MCLSLALGSFSQNFTHLVLSQGVAFGIGGCIAYSPSILYMSEWFDKRRGLAFGIVWAGSGLSGVLIPLALEKFLGQYGFRTTLRIFSVLIFVLAAPFLYFHKSRLPVSREVKYDRLNARFLCSRVSIIYQLGNIAEALGFFLPAIYLPTLARTLGASDFLASLTVTALNLASVFGSVSMGFLSDRWPTLTCVSISTAGTAVSVYLIWGFATTIPVLIVFGVAYGIFAGGYSAIWSGMIREIQNDNPAADATIIFSTIAFGRGVGNVVSGPFSEALIQADGWKGHAMAAYGSGFGLLIVCTGLTAVLGGLPLILHFSRCIK